MFENIEVDNHLSGTESQKYNLEPKTYASLELDQVLAGYVVALCPRASLAFIGFGTRLGTHNLVNT